MRGLLGLTEQTKAVKYQNQYHTPADTNMIAIEGRSAEDQMIFKKTVVVYTGHFNSGWAVTRPKDSPNDWINGFIAFGNGDDEPQRFYWWVPGGCVTKMQATYYSEQEALLAFKQRYGNRVVVWANPLVNENYLFSQFIRASAPVLFPGHFDVRAPENLSKISTFHEWATLFTDKAASEETEVYIPKQV